MKTAIIGVTNLKHMTLISLYTNLFERIEIQYDLVYIDKYGIIENNSAKHVYKYESNGETNNIFGKIKHAFGFRRFAKKILMKNNYDFIVVWREETAVIFSSFLKKYYKNRYCVNIRDLWNPYNFYINCCIRRALKYSSFNTIASNGFRKCLPNSYEYIFLSSVNPEMHDKKIKMQREYVKGKPLIVKSIGTFRNDNYFFKLVQKIKNDKRIEFWFIGQGSERMAKYCKKHHIRNVLTLDSFAPKNTIELLANSHIINCSSGLENMAEKLKIPIRFYYAVFNNMPVLVSKGTYISEIAGKLGIGIDIDENNVVDNILKKYTEFDYKSSTKLIDNFKKQIFEGQKFLEKYFWEKRW